VIRKQQQQREQFTKSESSRADRSSSQNSDENKKYDRNKSMKLMLRRHLDRLFLIFDSDDSDEEN